ncbi:MAG TPA: carboxypeptidase-like regulatory domain-containing protein [Cyclobacteriaceae bacterium]|nr:carboxypeptidase-like regulatory domain-containing protein [Cyclobacteriaceae bacterium]
MKVIISLLFSIMLINAYAQTKITGTVKDDKGEPIPGANIMIEGSYDGTSSNADGTFRFITDEPGAQTLLISFIGYRVFRQEIMCEARPLQFDVVLKEEINRLNAVTITAGAINASDNSRKEILRAIDIVTTASANADIAGALSTLPGAQRVGEEGRLFVRGGDAYETRTFIDGMVVLDAYEASPQGLPARNRFFPFMFKGTSFSTGGYSAEYGQALSSALALDSKDKAESNRTDISLMSVGGDVSHTSSWNRGSVAGKLGYTNIRPYYNIINQFVDWEKAPASFEANAAYRQQIGKEGMLKLYGNFSSADLSMYRNEIPDNGSKTLLSIHNQFAYLNASYRDILSDKVALRSGLSYTRNDNELMPGANKLAELQEGLHAKLVFDFTASDKLAVLWGAEHIARNYTQSMKMESFPTFSRGFDELLSASFLETEYYLSSKLVTRAGLRAEHNSLLNKFSADPRLAMAYQTGKHSQVSLAWGTFRQSTDNQLLVQATDLEQEKATHYILNYQLTQNRRTFRAETFYKQYDDLVKFDANGFSNAGYGYARGFDFFWRDNRTFQNADYWITYSFLDTKRDYRHFPVEAIPAFASRHNFSYVLKYFVESINSQLGLTYAFGSSRPYHDPNKNGFNQSRTPNYSDLSANISYLMNPKVIFHASVTNILGRDNIFGYRYAASPDANGVYASEAIRQAARHFVFVGCFITFSDAKVNQLPNL